MDVGALITISVYICVHVAGISLVLVETLSAYLVDMHRNARVPEACQPEVCASQYSHSILSI